MESPVANQESTNPPTKNGRTQITVGVPYPTETIEGVIQVARQMVAEHGTGRPITKEEIAKAVNKSSNGLSQYYSTLVQYGIFSTVHGKGYAPTELFRRYMNPVHEGDEHKYMMEMFKRPALYSKIIENQNGHVLPTDPKRFGNMLKDEPYGVTEYAAEKAARIFLENARNLGLLDSQNTFRLPNGEHQTHKLKEEHRQETPPVPPPVKDADLFELPIPLPNKRKAYLRYPLEDLSRKDIRVIQKALEFIASSIEDEDEDLIRETTNSQ